MKQVPECSLASILKGNKVSLLYVRYYVWKVHLYFENLFKNRVDTFGFYIFACNK